MPLIKPRFGDTGEYCKIFFSGAYLFQCLNSLSGNTPNRAACIAKSEGGEAVANYLIDAHL